MNLTSLDVSVRFLSTFHQTTSNGNLLGHKGIAHYHRGIRANFTNHCNQSHLANSQYPSKSSFFLFSPSLTHLLRHQNPLSTCTGISMLRMVEAIAGNDKLRHVVLEQERSKFFETFGGQASVSWSEEEQKMIVNILDNNHTLQRLQIRVFPFIFMAFSFINSRF